MTSTNASPHPEVDVAALPLCDAAARVAVYGGSFDPPHLGHACVILAALLTGRFDQIWVVPSCAHPSNKTLAPFELRLRLCALACSHFTENVHVVDIESRLAQPNYTAETVRFIRRHKPSLHLTLLLGSDAFSSLCTWQNFEYLVAECDFLLIPRASYPLAATPGDAARRTTCLPFLLPDISSTAIKNELGESRTSAWLDSRVLQEIYDAAAYQKNE